MFERRKILVGMGGNAYSNLQALTLLFRRLDFHMVVTADKTTDEIVVSLYKGNDLLKSESGPTVPVALRRLNTGMAKRFPEIMKEK